MRTKRVLSVLVLLAWLGIPKAQAATIGLSQLISDNALNVSVTSDACTTTVPSPAVAFSTANFSFTPQSSSGILGASSQRICIQNPTATAAWSVTLAATDGPTALWSNGTDSFDFNDLVPLGIDGLDADSVGGQLSWTGGGSLAGLSGCSTLGLLLGLPAAFVEGVIDDITLVTAAPIVSSPYCSFTYTASAANLSQAIPGSQAAGAPYTLNMTLTIS